MLQIYIYALHLNALTSDNKVQVLPDVISLSLRRRGRATRIIGQRANGDGHVLGTSQPATFLFTLTAGLIYFGP